MTRADLTEAVYQAIGLPLKESDAVVSAIFDSIVRSLRSGDKVEVRGFGGFHTRQRRGRIGRNPRTGAKVEVPPNRIRFGYYSSGVFADGSGAAGDPRFAGVRLDNCAGHPARRRAEADCRDWPMLSQETA
jgi:integration host factor subunit beta